MIAPDPGARSAVNRALTPRPRRRATENDEYAAFARRVLRAWARRVAAGDIDAITDMAAAVGELEDAMRQAVAGLRRKEYSWAEIAARLGVTRQAAQQRWGGGNRDLLGPTSHAPADCLPDDGHRTPPRRTPNRAEARATLLASPPGVRSRLTGGVLR